jgi:hypothetical protein
MPQIVASLWEHNGRESEINSAIWQHLSWLKAGAIFSLQKKLAVKTHNNLYLGLVTPSSG